MTTIEHPGANGQCPDYGSELDPCYKACALGRCVARDADPYELTRREYPEFFALIFGDDTKED